MIFSEFFEFRFSTFVFRILFFKFCFLNFVFRISFANFVFRIFFFGFRFSKLFSSIKYRYQTTDRFFFCPHSFAKMEALPDELLIRALSDVDGRGLARLECTSRRFASLHTLVTKQRRHEEPEPANVAAARRGSLGSQSRRCMPCYSPAGCELVQ